MAAINNWFICFLLFLLGCNSGISDTGVIVTPGGDTIAETTTDTVIVVPVDTVPRIYVDTVILKDTVYRVKQEDTIINLSLPDVYLSQVGIREATGRNDGKAVEMYLRSVGLGKGFAWCSAFVHWCLDSAGIKNNITAWSPTAHNPRNIVWSNRKLLREPQSGDVFTLYFPSLRRIAHTGFYHRRVNSKIYETVEGNTNGAGSREGDGVYKKKRSFNATYSITRWQNN